MTNSNASATWRSGDAYERYMGRWSRRLAPLFVQWLRAAPVLRWLDVGCGTGALCTAIIEHAAPRSLIGVDPSAGFLGTARGRLPITVSLQPGRADAIPLADESIDVVASCLVLNFAPDAHAALREMVRVTVAGGCVAACVWDYAQKMDLIRCYWDAAAQIDPSAAAQDQGERFPLCRPEALTAALADAGLTAIETAAIELPMHFANFDDHWQPFLGGQGPAPAHAMSLDAATRERLRERLPINADGSIDLAARAWAVRGSVAR